MALVVVESVDRCLVEEPKHEVNDADRVDDRHEALNGPVDFVEQRELSPVVEAGEQLEETNEDDTVVLAEAEATCKDHF